jgi:ABC-type Co2+ transport system permease subunit
MSSVKRALRYPILGIIAGYIAVILSSLALGMTLVESSPTNLVRILPSVATTLIGIFVLHHAYTGDLQ